MSSAILLPLYVVIFLVLIYMVGIRPQQKRKRELENLVSRLRPGDEVVTVSGIYGTVSELEGGGTLLLQVAEDVDIRVAVQSIARRVGDQPAAAATTTGAAEGDLSKD